jgi:methylenetetrahydrofolate dehydrogenase (NADP+)/methenyltetrahydrofolate cyclohydrolase
MIPAVVAALLDGKAIAAQIREEVRGSVARIRADGVDPTLGVLLVGENPASLLYVRSKTRACEDVGIAHETRRLPGSVTTADVLAEVKAFNTRKDIHGILVQLPLPAQVSTQDVLRSVHPLKDVDGFHPENVGLLVQNQPRFVPCTPAGIMEMLARAGITVASRRAVVIGRSEIVGKPLAFLLLHANATVTVCHSKTPNLAEVTREGELLFAAAGRPGLVRAEHVREGAVVVDVGSHTITREAEARDLLSPERFEAFKEKGQSVVGDVHAPSVSEKAGFLTPVPGGVGPLTIALLMSNTARAARLQA